MTCEEVRERLPEHVLGTLDDVSDLAIRRHLRGCAGCRREMDALGEGLAMFASAAHNTEPPPELEGRVLGALADEWEDAAPAPERASRGTARWAWLTAAAVALALVLSLTWGIGQHQHVRDIVAADRYTQLLHILGGKEFRAGTLVPAAGLSVQGSAVVYDSHEGQSWAAVFVRGQDLKGPATATLHSADGRSVDLYVHFQRDGSGSAWLVTAMDLQDFDQMTITGADGQVIATAALRPV
jgi:Putative zinc-finger